ncbi:lipoprotein insertase outer membrane protein LolB [Psychrobacter raelei]|uniref:Outer-membrane lipoprotein LolB n=1 Tax=Psychrobacter raelei TaxID=2565531 RepID=A0AAT9PEF2_9GAMM|nr:lipoprotein insertase outer membrane protein LolB [Psychrobacter sp. PraFG1]UNK05167.1 lipoprotein insertase outer membrane protein LolB [Psychrobacter sp. PraFG1]
MTLLFSSRAATVTQRPSDAMIDTSITATKPTNTPRMTKAWAGLALAACAVVITGCQTTQTLGGANTTQVVTAGDAQYPDLLKSFSIRGKIGVTTPKTQTAAAQSGSAFYVWAQEDERFAIDITGALGIGHTVIEYDGNTATLVSDRTGEISAASPEELLQQATGWQAPISQLRHWISGRPAPTDSNSELDAQGRLQTSQNGDWIARFDYKDSAAQTRRPNKITVMRNDGHRVILTIAHDK